MPADRFEILFVCHANMCRSPMAERLARKAFRPGTVAVSAGTHAWDGERMHPYTELVLKERGADTLGFASRRLTRAIVEHADLILTADRVQRAGCATLAPAAVRRVFTLRQFARIIAGLPKRPATMPEMLDAVRATLGQPVEPGEDDLTDPVGGPVEAFRVCADEIQRVLGIIVPT